MGTQLFAQTTGITSNISSELAEPHDTVTVTLGIDEPADAYYFGVQVRYNNIRLEFQEMKNNGLAMGGVSIADHLEEDVIGASVSRTEPLEEEESGELMELVFTVLQTSPVGVTDIQFEFAELYDSNGQEITVDQPEAVTLEIEEAVSDFRLTVDAFNEIFEGQTFPVLGRIYVNDVTVDEEVESERVTVWAGLNASNTDPSGWSEESWIEMEFLERDDGNYHLYEQGVGFGVEPGEYYIALRAQLDGEDFVYGGRSETGGGIWDGEENVSAGLVISENPPFRYTLVEWDFNDETTDPSRSLPFNDDAVFARDSDISISFSNSPSGRAARSSSWSFDEEEESSYWYTEFSTVGLEAITVTSIQRSTSAGPRDFKLQYSLDFENWVDVDGGEITVDDDYVTGVLDNLPLPEVLEDESEVFLRWILTSGFRVNGDLNITGSNDFDLLSIQGQNPAPVTVDVWPGDANNDGVVDEDDVLALGQNWLTQGPQPVYSGIDWAPRKVEGWIPVEATFADANGDGRVDYRDLLPLGLNFGDSREMGKRIAQPPLAEIRLDQAESGDRFRFRVEAESQVSITGVSYRYRVLNVDGDSWKISDQEPGRWAQNWRDIERLLGFEIRQPSDGPIVAGAYVYQGRTVSVPATDLVEFEIIAEENWPSGATLVLERITLLDEYGRQRPESVNLVQLTTVGNEPIDEMPRDTKLKQNYPNPFNPSTTIHYQLSENSEVRLSVFNTLGRKIATLVDHEQPAGFYDITFDGSGLSSGMYIYRLQAGDRVFNRKMLLLK